MARGSSLSLLGMYSWKDTLFDGMSFPSGFSADDKKLFVNNLVMECAELEILYSDWDFLKFAIDNWSAKELITWERLYKAAIMEYNPIENYNRTEDMTVTHAGDITHSGKDTNEASGSDSDTHIGYDSVTGSGTDTDRHSRTSFDSNTYANTEKIEMEKGSTQTQNYNSTVTHSNGRKDEFTHGHKITDTTSVTTSGNISGNIGVTTSQQMLEQELEVAPKLNIINIMIDSFKKRFCLLVY